MRQCVLFAVACLLVLVAVPALAARCSGPAAAPAGTVCETAAFGGRGGSRFRDVCPAGYYLGGIHVNAGSYVDSVSARCTPFNGPRDGTANIALDWHGGAGGNNFPASCPNGESFSTIAVSVAVEDGRRRFVRHIQLVCRNGGSVCAGFGGKQCLAEAEDELLSETCPSGMVATGIHGSSGNFVDRFGIICDRPPISARVEIDEALKELDIDSGIIAAPVDVTPLEQPPVIFALPTPRPAPGVDFTGVWETIASSGNTFRMTLLQDGSGFVTGQYTPNNGRITSGAVVGNQLIGRWAQGANDSGRLIFTLSPDGSAFSGLWSAGNNDVSPQTAEGTWNGVRQGAAAQQTPPQPPPPTTPPAPPQTTPPPPPQTALTAATVKQDANVRAGPGTGHAIIGTLPRGTQLGVIGCVKGWCQIAVAQNAPAYIAQSLLILQGSAATVPAQQPQPSPQAPPPPSGGTQVPTPPPPPPPPPPVQQAGPSFTGTWSTVTGSGNQYMLVMQDNNGHVTGTYSPRNGSLNGTIGADGRLVFRWSEDGATGTGIFELSPDGRTFGGTFSGTDDPNRIDGSWFGTRN